MPKVRKLIKPDPRETDLLREIGGAAAATGKSYRQICKRAGIEYATFMLHKSNVKQMRFGELWAFLDACRKETGEI